MDRVDDGKKALVSGCSVSPRLVRASDSWELGTSSFKLHCQGRASLGSSQPLEASAVTINLPPMSV